MTRKKTQTLSSLGSGCCTAGCTSTVVFYDFILLTKYFNREESLPTVCVGCQSLSLGNYWEALKLDSVALL